MTKAPARPKIFHITSVMNLPSIVRDGGLVSDAQMVARGGPATSIGMTKLKARRLGLPVKCHPGDVVGDYVPFYFCPRSVMLYLLFRSNHPELTYQGGQEPIVHLEADLHDVIEWASRHGVRWALTPSNAAAIYNADFFSSKRDLDRIDWDAVNAPDFRLPRVKEGKQAEFLVHGRFPWGLVSAIGVHAQNILDETVRALSTAAHRPPVTIQPTWYY